MNRLEEFFYDGHEKKRKELSGDLKGKEKDIAWFFGEEYDKKVISHSPDDPWLGIRAPDFYMQSLEIAKEGAEIIVDYLNKSKEAGKWLEFRREDMRGQEDYLVKMGCFVRAGRKKDEETYILSEYAAEEIAKNFFRLSENSR